MDPSLLIPVVIAVALVLVLAGIALAGGFSSGAVSQKAVERLALATGWRAEREREGSRDATVIRPTSGDWRITLRSAERSGARSTGGMAAVTAMGGSGTAWHVPQPGCNAGFVAVARGAPLPEGAENDVLRGPLGPMASMLLAKLMPLLAGGPTPPPARLVAFRCGDAAFDEAHSCLTDNPELARQIVTAEVRAALGAMGPAEPSLVVSGAGIQLARPGGPDASAETLVALVACGERVRADVARSLAPV